jgi:predicted metal-dependent HD superfamily phosphohydrolase
VTHLHDGWPALLHDHPEILDRLLTAYREPHRGYHDLTHVEEVLDRVDTLLAAEPTAPDEADRTSVVLAAWFHDAVYEGSRDDEERSAVLAERELSTVDVPPLLVEEVARLVRLTADHRPEPGDRAGEVLCDADLGILAADPARYDEYRQAVRREYAHLGEEDFRVGRTRVLHALLEGDSLFRTDHARRHWEERARRNVRRELAELEDQAPHARPARSEPA